MELFDYDPLTGIRTLWDYDEETGQGHLRREQDVTALLSAVAEIRNEGRPDLNLKADDYMCLYAVIPPGVELELLGKGINIHDKNCTKRLLQEINANYPALKATTKTHVANQ